jgi:hypothetical protein
MTNPALDGPGSSRPRPHRVRRRHRLYLALLAPLLGQLSSSPATAQDLEVPDRLRVCEGQDRQTCGTWTFSGSQGTGRWDNGAVADLLVQQFDPDWIIIRRSDPPGGATPGLTAIYRGKLTGDRIAGTVTWTWLGHWNKQVEGTWSATLNHPGSPTPTPEPPRTDPGAPPPVPDGPGSDQPAAPHALPAAMHWCAMHCITLVWKTDHYTNAAAPGNSVLTVESFTPESVLLHRTDFKPHPATAVLTGKLSPHGDSIVDGTITWTDHPERSFPFTAAWGAALDTVPGSDQERARRLQPPPEVQAKVCGSRRIRLAMQALALQTMHDPNAQALRFFGFLFMGAYLKTDPPLIVDSKVAENYADLAVDDPGSFICVGLFAQGALHAWVSPDADDAADLTVAAAQAIMATHPPGFMWFKVKALHEGRYQLAVVPVGVALALKYSTEFTLPSH